jgi:hypothetical protein
VGARDGDVALEPHELGEHLGAAHHGQASGAGLVELGIARLNGGGDDDDLGPLQVLGPLADVDHGPLLREGASAVVLLRVRALYPVAHGNQHLGNPGHADAADADEMDGAHVLRQLCRPLPLCGILHDAPPANASTSLASLSAASGLP